MSRRLHLALISGLLLGVTFSAAAPGLARTTQAGAPITPALAQALDAGLTTVREPDGCTLERIDTDGFSVTVGLKTGSGLEHALTLWVALSPGSAPRTAGAWSLDVAPELVRECAATLAAIERVLKGIDVAVESGDITAAPLDPPPVVRLGSLELRAIQIGWLALLVGTPWLCWRGGRACGIGGGVALLVVTLAVGLAVAVTWQRGDEPLHANGHAWREAREVLIPWGVRGHGLAPFVHGLGGISLQWLVAAGERAVTGSVNPFLISRVAGAAAAGATAFLVLILIRSPWAAVAAGAVLALTPLQQALALSGSALTICAWLLPWSLGLLIAAGLFGDRVLLAGAALAVGLATISHTAMLAWAPALAVAWLCVARREIRLSAAALAAILFVVAAWVVQLETSYEMLVSRNEGPGLLRLARLGVWDRNLFADPHWVSPALPILAGLWIVGSLRRGYFATMLASVLAALSVAVPLFAVNACSSDAVRYQGVLLGLLTSFAVGGLWRIPLAQWLGGGGATVLRGLLLAALVVLPLPKHRPPIDPVAAEHQLVEKAVRRMQPHTLIVLPKDRLAGGNILADFPDFLLPEDSSVTFAGDPRIKTHDGPLLYYLGLACISYGAEAGDSGPAPATNLAVAERKMFTENSIELTGLRPECSALQKGTVPWLVRTLKPYEIPSGATVERWTFHRLAINTAFGFFAPAPS